jgi:hypothetical protein
VAVDAAGDVLIADSSNNRIRWVDGHGIIYTVAGDGTYGFSGNGGAAAGAELAAPLGVGVDPSGNIYIADTGNDLVRELTAVANLNSSAYSVSFPAQRVGTTSQPRTIRLTGVGPLTISSVRAGGDFAVKDHCPASLPSGESCTVDVIFSPCVVGHVHGTLVIETNGFFNPTITITLRGTGER